MDGPDTTQGADPGPWPLEPSPEEMRRLLAETAERIVEQIRTLPEQHASYNDGAAEVAAAVREDWPGEPQPLPEVLDLLFDRLAPVSYNNAGPGFLAFIPGGGLFFSALADLVAGILNRYTAIWAAAPGLVQLEMNVLRWFCSIVGFPPSAGGFLSSGGSTAHFSALVTARRTLLPENFLHGTLYVSAQTHHSIGKAALLAGFPQSSLRTVPTDASFRMRPDVLEAMIVEDRQRGRQPFFIVGNGGTTNSGAIDPLPEMAEIADRHGLWFHIDAAYGGFFALTERGRQRLAGMELADSVILDPHKSLFLPYGTGCLLVKDLNKLRGAHSAGADYMPPIQDAADRIDFSEISPELSRDYRGLRVWLPFKLVGVEPFRVALDEKLDLAEWAAEQLRQIDGIDIVAEPQLSTLAFRMRHGDLDAEALDDLNQRLLGKINQAQRVFLTSTRLDGSFVIRICVLGFRTHQDRMDMCMEDIRRGMAAIRAELTSESADP